MNAARLMRITLKVVLVGTVLLAPLLLALATIQKPAEATYPGKNGNILYVKDACGEGCIAVWTASPGDSTSRLVVPSNYSPNSATYTSDGDRIVYAERRGIYTTPASSFAVVEGTLLAQIGDGIQWYRSPSLSPDGKTLVVEGHGDYFDPIGIYTIQVPGGEPKRIADGWGPEWSPDGRRISYVNDSGIWTIPAAGGTPSLVTDEVPLAFVRTFFTTSWSPDGERIAYMGPSLMGIPNFEVSVLYTVPASGGTPQPIYETRLGSGRPAYSPDGRYIAFAAGSPGGGSVDIYRVPSEGGPAERIIQGYSRGIYDIDWQPLPATSKTDCKKGGYKDFGFKNQGKCVAFVQRGGQEQ